MKDLRQRAVRLEVLPCQEAVAFALKRTGWDDQRAAAALVEALGGLPLAAGQSKTNAIAQPPKGLDDTHLSTQHPRP